MNKILPDEIAEKFKITVDYLFKKLGNESWPELCYEILDPSEAEIIQNEILNTIQNSNLREVGGNDNMPWERGWGEIFARANSLGFHPEIIRPQYFDSHKILRYSGKYIRTLSPNFLYEFDTLLRRIFFAIYIDDVAKIVELGCGTGNSQIILSELFPKTNLIAADWAKSSQDLIQLISTYLDKEIKAVNFNMLTLEGRGGIEIDSETCVLTVHSMEQLGKNYKELLNFLLNKKPKYIVNIEPVLEFYNPKSKHDSLAISYHKKRRYLDGYLSELRLLQKNGKIKIIEEMRFGFGDRNHEAYSLIKWECI